MLHKDVLIRLCKARDLLRETEEWLLVPQLAREIGMSPYHFIRLFKAVFGETPKQCQLDARLEKAKHFLLATDTSITDICMEAGFSSLGTFSYVFAGRVGMRKVCDKVKQNAAQNVSILEDKTKPLQNEDRRCLTDGALQYLSQGDSYVGSTSEKTGNCGYPVPARAGCDR